MKNLILSIGIVGVFALSSAFIPAKENSYKVTKHLQGEICFKIKNDMGRTITLHTGSGTRTINNMVVQEFCLKEGTKLSPVEQGRVGRPILSVEQGHQGKTLNLSDLMR